MFPGSDKIANGMTRHWLKVSLLCANVLWPVSAQNAPQQRFSSKVSVYELRGRATQVIYQSNDLFEAPNWSKDGTYLLTNSGGKLYRVPVGGGDAAAVALDPSLRCNNDHGISPDGKQVVISASSPSSRQSQIHVAGIDGSNARLIVEAAPSYYHGWSPNGKMLAFVANRKGNFDLFSVPAAGGQEKQLTSDAAYDDGPDYSPDGKWIYFNSDRGGSWNIWRIPAEGAGSGDRDAQQVTIDEWEDWFPHPSPDGKWLVFLSFPKGTQGHNGRMDIELRMVPLPGKKLKPVQPQTVVKLFGGQGTINVNSWSPDSKRFAFVEYQPHAQTPNPGK